MTKVMIDEKDGEIIMTKVKTWDIKSVQLNDLVKDEKTLEGLKLFIIADHRNKNLVDLCIRHGKQSMVLAEIKVFARDNPDDFFKDFEAAMVIAEDIVSAFNDKGLRRTKQ